VTAPGEIGTDGACGSISGMTRPPADARLYGVEGVVGRGESVGQQAEQAAAVALRKGRDGPGDLIASIEAAHEAGTRSCGRPGAGLLSGVADAGTPDGDSAVTARKLGGAPCRSALASRPAGEADHGGRASFAAMGGDRTARSPSSRLPVRSAGLAALVLAAGLAVAACGYTGSGPAEVRSWVAESSFVANERQVLADVRSVELAVAHGSALQLRTVCGGLSSDAGTLYETLPTPDHTLTDELGGSMETLFPAATSCAVASSTKSARVARDLVTIERAMKELARARQRLAADGIRSPQVPPVTLPK
jgi:hypothetical protein